MAEKFINKKDFINNLPKIYGTYTGGFFNIHHIDGYLLQNKPV